MIAVSVDPRAVLTKLASARKNTKLAIVDALNDTAKDVQKAVRAQVQRQFTVRSGQKREFFLRQAAIIRFAKFATGLFEASVRVGEKPRLLLSMFEAGGVRKAFVGKNIAVPVVGTARPSQQEEVKPSLWVKRLGLRKRGGTRTGKTILVGNQGTFLVGGVGIFQQQGGKAAPKLLYAFIPQARLKPVLRFIQTARGVAVRYHRHLTYHMKRRGAT